jgi:hypothetical protein
MWIKLRSHSRAHHTGGNSKIESYGNSAAEETHYDSQGRRGVRDNWEPKRPSAWNQLPVKAGSLSLARFEGRSIERWRARRSAGITMMVVVRNVRGQSPFMVLRS